VQRSLSGIPSMTCGTCLPHPHQEEREQLGQVPRMHISRILVLEENTGWHWYGAFETREEGRMMEMSGK
jgi:hypothetical protein